MIRWSARAGLLVLVLTFTARLFAQTDVQIVTKLLQVGELLSQGEVNQARSELNALKKSYPKDPRPFYVLALIGAQEGKMKEAEQDLRASIRVAPGFFLSHWTLGSLLIDGGKPDEGIAELREAIRLNPQFADAHNDLGRVLEEKDDDQGALLEFQKAAQLEPNKYLAPLRVLAGHSNRVWTMVFSRDSKLLASGSLDETVKVWDVESGRSLDTYKLDGNAFPIDFSSDGKFIATGSSDILSKQHSFKFWDVNSGHEVHPGHSPEDLRGIAFTSDWDYVARYVEGKGQIELWDFERGAQLHILNPGDSPFVSLAKFSPDGRLFATPAAKNMAKVYDVETGQEVFSVKGEPAAAETGVVGVFFNTDGSLVTVVDALKNVKVCDVKTGRVLKNIPVDLGGINIVEYVALSPDGRWLATETSGGRALLTDLAQGKTCTLFGHRKGTNGVAISPDGRWLATASWAGQVKLWKIPINEGADNLAPFSDATTVPSIDLGIESPTTTKTTVAPAPTLDSSPPSAPRPQPIRVNGGVQQANLISVVQPVYPPEAKRARILGVVVLEAVIDKDGTVDNLKVITGHPLLIQAAIDAVKQWRYKPTLLNGELVPVVTTVTLNFTYK